jgi:hypothetical protein
LTERLLSSLFLEYLESSGFTFTISVFMPESQMASWRPFSYDEMLELLHLDPSSDLHTRLKLVCHFFLPTSSKPCVVPPLRASFLMGFIILCSFEICRCGRNIIKLMYGSAGWRAKRVPSPPTGDGVAADGSAKLHPGGFNANLASRSLQAHIDPTNLQI